MNAILNQIIRICYTYLRKIQFLLFVLYFDVKLLFSFRVYPYKFTVKLNNNCNLQCNYCHIWKNKDQKQLSDKNLEKLITQYGKYIRILSFTWWETFLLKDLEDKIDFCIHNCKKLHIFSLTTNGFFTKNIEKTVESILKRVNNKIIIINISIDGDEKTHNNLRGHNLSYQNAISTYERLLGLKKKYPNLQVNKEFLLSASNKQQALEHVRSKNTIISVVQNSEYYGVNDITDNNNLIKPDMVLQAQWFIKKRFLRWYISKKYNCYASRSSLFLNWDGTIQPCIVWSKKIGNIKNNNIAEDIQKGEYTWVQNTIKNKKCPGCWTPCEWYLSVIHEFWK